MLYEYMTVWRSIPIDGRGHPKDVTPSFMGNSVGKWDGDTLVIDHHRAQGESVAR